jgi:hypothetical protein
MSETRSINRGTALTAAVLTALYWFWESRAEGNIRVDLLLIYPVLFGCYIGAFWPRFKSGSILLALALMVVNAGWFVVSYDLFDKHPG